MNYKKIILIIFILLIILILFSMYTYIINNEDNEKNENNVVDIQENKDVDLSTLNTYMGSMIPNEKGIEMLNKIKEEYKNYLSNSTENGESTGLYIYFSNDIESNLEEIKNNAIISMIDSYINTIENDNNIGYFSVSTGVDNENRQYIYIQKYFEILDEGIITNIDNGSITINNNTYKVNENIEFSNLRTTESMKLSDIKPGDYYYGSGKIIRNITGDEWEKECIKNLAYCYEEGNLMCNPIEIKNVENMGDYVIITLIMGDSATEYLNGEDNISTFELKAIAYSSLNIPTYSGGVTVYNLKEETQGFMFWIGLDKNTIDDKYPVISDIEIYDK